MRTWRRPEKLKLGDGPQGQIQELAGLLRFGQGGVNFYHVLDKSPSKRKSESQNFLDFFPMPTQGFKIAELHETHFPPFLLVRCPIKSTNKHSVSQAELSIVSYSSLLQWRHNDQEVTPPFFYPSKNQTRKKIKELFL